ncbi:MAG: 3-deoxy-D-manno-octulosonic-acid transferase [Bacteroidia bacterium]|jgi:3-deoxy-D-manno-octulosonic-acid transferase
MRLLYSALLIVLLPFVLLRLLWRSRKQPALRDQLRQRFGFVPPSQGTAPLWLHAVSVGEVQAASPLIEALLVELPQIPLVVSTTTPTGAALLQQKFGDRVRHVYCPWDLPAAVARGLKRIRPRALVLMETELWPNLVQGCRAINCPVLLLNARMSVRSADRYRWGGLMIRNMLGEIAHIACQTEQDAQRFRDLGANTEQVSVLGNLKYEVQPDRQALERLRQSLALAGRLVLVAGSTHPGEEEQIYEAFRRLKAEWQDCLLILAPRHPERATDVAAALGQRGWLVQRRSQGILLNMNDDVLLIDGVGELALFYGLADVAFVGGSLVKRGGHNPLEPACLGVPVICGPSNFNFADAGAQLREVGAMRVVADADELICVVQTIFRDRELKREMGEAGLEVVERQRGALPRCLALVLRALADH